MLAPAGCVGLAENKQLERKNSFDDFAEVVMHSGCALAVPPYVGTTSLTTRTGYQPACIATVDDQSYGVFKCFLRLLLDI